LINSLTAVRELKVIARTTAFRYKGKEVDPQTIGRELKVASLLTGSVRPERDSLAVQVDLVDTENGTQLWGEEFQRQLSDLVSVKQTIARVRRQTNTINFSTDLPLAQGIQFCAGEGSATA